MIYPANILITNYCNQSCPFCFASREMKSKTLDREMSMNDYRKALQKIKRSKQYKVIKLLGGEPTLHAHLFEMLDMAVEDGLMVQIFTNGIMKHEISERLKRYVPHVGYTFNCVTPGFQYNTDIRNKVIQNMRGLSEKSHVTTSITIDPFFRIDNFMELARQVFPFLHSIRIGFSNPIAGGRNWYSFKDFPKMGGILVEFMEVARKYGFKGEFTMNCGFTRCMFTNDQFAYIKKELKYIGWSCFGKESSMDVAVDMSAFHCFPLSEHKRVNLKTNGYTKANSILIKERMRLWDNLKKDVCLKCPHYGFGGDKCPGPCLAFAMNEQKHRSQY